MTFWKTEEDFLNDLDVLSFDSNLAVSKTQVYNPTKNMKEKKNEDLPLWYEDGDEESDNEEEFVPYSKEPYSSYKNRGRGRLPTEPTNHLQVMNEIRREVRSTVGNCYHNDAIESFYYMLQSEDSQKYEDAMQDTFKQLPKKVIEPVENIENSTRARLNGVVHEPKPLNDVIQPLSSMLFNGKQYSGRGCRKSRNTQNNIDISSKYEFPQL